MKKNNSSIIISIAFFILGIIIFIHPDMVVKFISYFVGGVLILVGIYKCVNYYIQNKRLKVVNRNEMAFGITAIILGIVFIFLASAIELLLRFIIGIYLILVGLNKLISTFYTTDRSKKFYSLIVVGLVFLAAGIYIIAVSNLALSIIGLFMVLYGIIDFISYFIYKNDKVTEKEEDKPNDNNLVIEAEVVEDTKSKPKKSKNKKKSNK